MQIELLEESVSSFQTVTVTQEVIISLAVVKILYFALL